MNRHSLYTHLIGRQYSYRIKSISQLGSLRI
nr:MAG TPA: hypothetical protein [Caudoviricetes sp.]